VIAVDKYRNDPDAPHRYGATITRDFSVRPKIIRESMRNWKAANAGTPELLNGAIVLPADPPRLAAGMH
jgi:hypothetical protein